MLFQSLMDDISFGGESAAGRGPGQLEATYQVVWRERQDAELLGLSAGLGGGAKPGGGQGRTVGLTSEASGSGVPKTGEETGNIIKNGSLESLPKNAQIMYRKYSEHGWKGSVPGQTVGTAAGSKYLNRDRKLPYIDNSGNPITYKEFDVNNRLPNQSRDGERFVVGSDGSIYYTNDHYNTFIRIK